MSSGRPVEALARGIRILEVLSRASGPLTNGQIARATELPPSTVSRLTDSLVQLGYLRFTSDQGAYRLTPKNLRLGYPVLANTPLASRAQRVLDEMSSETGCTSALAVRDELHVAFLATARGRDLRSVPLAVGGRLPISMSAAGIALLAAMEEPQKSRLVRSIRSDLTARGHSVKDFEESLSVGRDLLVVNRGRWRSEIGGVAAPLRSGGELYALTFAVRVEYLDDGGEDRLLTSMRAAVDRLSD